MRFDSFACCALAATVAAGCGDDSAAPALAACRPFTIETTAIELGAVLGAGRDTSGTVYVVDESDGLRAFVGSETSLVRVPVVGSSQSNLGAGGTRDALTIGAQPSAYQLIVERQGDDVRMGRTLELELDLSIAELHATELLEVIDGASLADAELRNLPTGVNVEYLARLPEGELILVLRPASEDGVDYDAFRVFYGTETSLTERELVSVTRARDGGSTHVVFKLNGATADAFFPVNLQGEPPPATLDHDGEVATLERLDPAAHAELLAEARFECLE